VILLKPMLKNNKYEAVLLAVACTFYIGIPLGNTNITIRLMDGIVPLLFGASLLNPDNRKLMKKDVVIWGWLLIFSAAFSVLFAAGIDHERYLRAWLKVFRLSMPMMMMCTALPWKKEESIAFVKCILWTGAAQSLFAIAMYWIQYVPFCALQTTVVNGKTVFRASGFVKDAASFGLICAFLAILSIAVLTFRIPGCIVGAKACLITSLLGLFASGTRTAGFALVLALLLAAFLRWLDSSKSLSSRKMLWNVPTCIFVAVACYLLLVYGSLEMRKDGQLFCSYLLGAAGENGNLLGQINMCLSERLRIWVQYLSVLIGQGLIPHLVGNGYFVFEEKLHIYSFAGSEQIFGRPTHNMYLCVLVGMGLVGWLCFGGFIRSAIKQVMKSYKHDGFFENVAVMLLIAELISMLFDDSLGMVNSTGIVFMFFAIAGGGQMEEKMPAITDSKDARVGILLYCDHWQNGGVESYLMNLLRNGRPEKVKCDLLTADKTTDIYDKELDKMDIRHTVLLQKQYKSPVARILHTFGAFRAYLKQNRYDIVYLNLTNSVTMYYAQIAKEEGVPQRIVHSHCSDVQPGITREIKRIGSMLARAVYSEAVTDCWACSDKAGEWMFPQKMQNKIVFIPNAIQTQRFAFQEEGRERIRRQLEAENKTIVGTVGRCVSEKNQCFLLQAFADYHKQHEDSVLLLVGDGPLRNDLETKARELGVWQACIFYGSVSAEKIPALLWAMDLFCLPSILEGNPVSGVEAQAAGCRCLLSDNITQQAKILPDTMFLSIKNGTNGWSQAMSYMLKQECDRKAASAKVCAAGYDVASSSLKTWTMLEKCK
jgi:glycosyltransferase involved in cell wall biosynthesis